MLWRPRPRSNAIACSRRFSEPSEGWKHEEEPDEKYSCASVANTPPITRQIEADGITR